MLKLRLRDWCLRKFIHVNKRILPQDGKNHITLSMITHDEGGRYLFEVLDQVRHCISNAVFIDDNSSDNTIDVIRTVLHGVETKLIHTSRSLFEDDESKLRILLWNETIKIMPEWILCLDADEKFEDNFENRLGKLLESTKYDYYRFRLFDMWNDPNHYRYDENWKAHKLYKPFLYRFYPFFPYSWNSAKLHCGRTPKNLPLFDGCRSEIRIKHLGWMKESDRCRKFERYNKLDGEGKYGIKSQYDSILDKNPNLVEWDNKDDFTDG